MGFRMVYELSHLDEKKFWQIFCIRWYLNQKYAKKNNSFNNFDMSVKKGKMPKKSAKEMINRDNKRITIFCINIRPGRSTNRKPRAGRSAD